MTDTAEQNHVERMQLMQANYALLSVSDRRVLVEIDARLRRKLIREELLASEADSEGGEHD
jgi:hypothetical protein